MGILSDQPQLEQGQPAGIAEAADSPPKAVRCSECNRPLTDPASIKRVIGPVCAGGRRPGGATRVRRSGGRIRTRSDSAATPSAAEGFLPFEEELP
jgi:hypothetical protein